VVYERSGAVGAVLSACTTTLGQRSKRWEEPLRSGAYLHSDQVAVRRLRSRAPPLRECVFWWEWNVRVRDHNDQRRGDGESLGHRAGRRQRRDGVCDEQSGSTRRGAGAQRSARRCDCRDELSWPIHDEAPGGPVHVRCGDARGLCVSPSSRAGHGRSPDRGRASLRRAVVHRSRTSLGVVNAHSGVLLLRVGWMSDKL